MRFTQLTLAPIIRSGGTAALVLLFFTSGVVSGVASAQRIPPPDTAAQPRPEPDLAGMDLEQLMKIEVVVAASKRARPTRDVPSSVSVVTAAQIREHGYRTLGDVLKTLPSFYVNNDRNYSFIGVRGFSRPGDYSSRILLLLDGLRTNDNIYDQAYIGEEFLVDVDLIDRIEVIRGPSAALYGSNAFFAVINVITKAGRSVNGEVAASAASFGTYAGRASYGQVFANALDVLVSASFSDSKGQPLYFAEYDSPSTNNGIAEAGDRESSRKFMAKARWGDFSLQATNFSRAKGIPTGAYETLFNDRRSRTIDGTTLASLGYHRSFANDVTLSARLHAGRNTYNCQYAYDPTLAPNVDDNVGDWWGIDVDASRPLFARHFVTAGVEYRDNVRQDQANFDPEPFVLYTDARNNSSNWGMFAQDEIRLFQPLTVYAGARLDRYRNFGSVASPRLGLIYTPGTATTVKLLAGRAFRAPNQYEMFYESSLLGSNPQLKPERIETLELVAQRLVVGGVQISAAMFRNRLSALISHRVDSTDNARLRFENADEIESKGIELGLEVNRGHGTTGSLTYALQRTNDRATNLLLSNSPRHMAKVRVLVPLAGKKLTAGIDAQYLSSRLTLARNSAPGYAVANVSLLAPRVFGRIAVSAMVYNLFDTKYGNPGSRVHRQDVIAENGRNFRVKTTLHY